MRPIAVISTFLVFFLNSCTTTTPDGKPNGETIYQQYCVTCHGGNGKLGLNGAKDLTTSALTLEERVGIIANGRKLMASFSGILEENEIRAVAEYTMSLASH